MTRIVNPQTKLTVELTIQESQGILAALIWGVPDPVPAEIESAQAKIKAALA